MEHEYWFVFDIIFASNWILVKNREHAFRVINITSFVALVTQVDTY